MPQNLPQLNNFSARHQKTKHPWRVLSGISALADKSTFMPTRKQTRRTDVTTWKENYENANHLINEQR
jgi:hypothetical protein